jgi:hypothetical protein
MATSGGNFLALWVWEAFGAIQDEKYLKWQ